MAAGVGSRLQPVTERYAKPVLPIDGRPVVAALLHELAAAGVARVTVVTGHLAEQVEALLGSPAFGVEVRFVRQPRPDGSADAVVRAVRAGVSAPFLVSAADTLYTSGDVDRFTRSFEISAADGALAVRRDPPPGPARAAVRIREGCVERVIDPDPGNPLSAAPLWVFGAAAARFLDGLHGPPYELAEALQRAIDAGHRAAGIEIGPTRDLTRPVDLVRENFPYLWTL